jgi:hypothetical protein
MGRRQVPRASTRTCQRCGRAAALFSLPRNLQRVCDLCKADPGSKVRHASLSAIVWRRCRAEATRQLIEAHRDEYDALFAKAREELTVDNVFEGATLREVDDYRRRVDEAADAIARARAEPAA